MRCATELLSLSLSISYEPGLMLKISLTTADRASEPMLCGSTEKIFHCQEYAQHSLT
jgi:hypothetical protein